MAENKRQAEVKLLRQARKLHRISGISLFVFFFLVAITGLLLGWKKNSGGLILAKSMKGISTDLTTWLPVDSLEQLAFAYLRDSIDADLSTKLNRIDIRPNKGMVKFVFDDHYWGLQVDGTTGELLQIERRRSDMIENIHDGSIVDNYLGLNGFFKLFYTSVMGLALVIFTVTGFWLWYGPRRLRAAKRV